MDRWHLKRELANGQGQLSWKFKQEHLANRTNAESVFKTILESIKEINKELRYSEEQVFHVRKGKFYILFVLIS